MISLGVIRGVTSCPRGATPTSPRDVHGLPGSETAPQQSRAYAEMACPLQLWSAWRGMWSAIGRQVKSVSAMFWVTVGPSCRQLPTPEQKGTVAPRLRTRRHLTVKGSPASHGQASRAQVHMLRDDKAFAHRPSCQTPGMAEFGVFASGVSTLYSGDAAR